MANKSLIRMLVQNDLKVTPQRVAILEAILALETHPAADDITEVLRLTHPNISLATIYNTLETFSKKGIIHKVSTDNDTTRYDPISERHHHLYCPESGRIEDFYDEELNKILDDNLTKKKIPNFTIEDFRLQIRGRFTDSKVNK